MTRYRNGYLPASVLQWFDSGGEKFRATAPTIARWNALVADVKAHEGITLTITSGANAYRDYAQQVQARREHGLGAATPGTSSHGGTFEGGDTLAIDVYNWAALGQAKFYSYARKHGFTPGLISRARGYARDEPWHIVDKNPYSGGSVAGSIIGGIMATAAEIWAYAVNRSDKNGKKYKVSAIQELADAKSNTMDIKDELSPVLRGGKKVRMRQDLADTGTIVRQVLAEQKAMRTALEALATAKGADPAAIAKIVDDAVKNAMKDVSFSVDVD